jgi:5,10-methylene-tetrahydrofolate dehydrogenase/methenyl tetrahydrofolate cyclohydrolase
MVAQIIDGKKIAENILNRLKSEVVLLQARNISPQTI